MTLQQQWDIWLVASFNKYPSAGIRFCIHRFEEKMGMREGDLFLSGIKRVPKMDGKRSFVTVSRFVCGFIKGASEFMFEQMNAIQKSAMLAKCGDSLVDSVDSRKVLSESKEKSKAKKLFKRANDEYSLGNKQREAYGRRNWSACK